MVNPPPLTTVSKITLPTANGNITKFQLANCSPTKPTAKYILIPTAVILLVQPSLTHTLKCPHLRIQPTILFLHLGFWGWMVNPGSVVANSTTHVYSTSNVFKPKVIISDGISAFIKDLTVSVSSSN